MIPHSVNYRNAVFWLVIIAVLVWALVAVYVDLLKRMLDMRVKEAQERYGAQW